MERLLEAVIGTGTKTTHGIRVEKFGKNIYLTTKNGIDEFVLKEDENYYDKVLEILTKKFEEIKNSVGRIIDTKDEEACYGKVGYKTKMKDVLGNELYSGDIVEVTDVEKDKTYRTFVSLDYIIGLNTKCENLKNGLIGKEYIVRRIKSYKNLLPNERCGRLMYEEY